MVNGQAAHSVLRESRNVAKNESCHRWQSCSNFGREMTNTTFVQSTTYLRFAVVLALFLAFTGCDGNKTRASKQDQKVPNAHPDWQAEQVLEHMQTAYANAQSYSDKAVLYLTLSLIHI